jgi:uncharacterized protein YeaO (DUF488 family)
MPIQVKRVYEPAEADDGVRVLVDRLWPRGLSKEKARVDEWLKELGPSTALRKWFNHDPGRWDEFRTRYRAELASPEQRQRLDHLRALARQKTVSVLYGARDSEHNEAVVIAEEVTR